MKKLLIWLGTVLILGSLTACEILYRTSVSEGFTIAGDQDGQSPITGSSACDPNKKVNIQVVVSGGSQGATFTVNAFCDRVPLGGATVTDSGTGRASMKTATHTQDTGIGSCTPLTTTSPSWSYICDFNQ